MGQNETSVIDAQTTAAEPTPSPTVRRDGLLAAAAAVVAVAAGVVVWITAGTDTTSADRQASGKTGASASASSPSDATPTDSAAPAVGPSANAPSTGAAPSAGAGTGTGSAPAPVPTGWESRTFQGLVFSVPPGAVAPDVQDPGSADVPASFVWTGPSVGDGTNAQISVRISPAGTAPTLGPEYQALTVRGADEADVRTGSIDSQPPLTAVDVYILAGGRYINVVAMFAADAAGEQMARDLVASLSLD